MLFLTTHANTKQRMSKGETLIKRKFVDRVVNNKEGPTANGLLLHCVGAPDYLILSLLIV